MTIPRAAGTGEGPPVPRTPPARTPPRRRPPPARCPAKHRGAGPVQRHPDRLRVVVAQGQRVQPARDGHRARRSPRKMGGAARATWVQLRASGPPGEPEHELAQLVFVGQQEGERGARSEQAPQDDAGQERRGHVGTSSRPGTGPPGGGRPRSNRGRWPPARTQTGAHGRWKSTKTAANEPPLAMPRREGSAMGLRKRAWKAAPEAERAAPTRATTTTARCPHLPDDSGFHAGMPRSSEQRAQRGRHGEVGASGQEGGEHRAASARGAGGKRRFTGSGAGTPEGIPGPRPWRSPGVERRRASPRGD
jgi:hypothetical protein